MTIAPFPAKPKAETAAQAVQRMELEASAAAMRVASELNADLASVAADCLTAASMRSLPPGVRDLYRRLGERIEGDLQTVNAITGRA